jgi:hypothetical protein
MHLKCWKNIINQIKINDNYTAEISKTTITVGCQEISIDKVKEIIELHNELYPSND